MPGASIIPDVAGPEQAARVGQKMEIAGFRRYVFLANTWSGNLSKRTEFVKLNTGRGGTHRGRTKMRNRARAARKLFRMGEDARAKRVLWGAKRKLKYEGQRMSSGPPDLPRALGWAMALGAAVVLAVFAAVAVDRWPDLTARFGPQVVVQVGANGARELVVRRDRNGHYVVPGSVNGVAVEFLLDTGATDVAIPPTLARQLSLTRGAEVEIHTASDVIPGYLVTLDEVSVGPLSLRRVRGSVSERAIHDEVLLGMAFLRHFELSQRGRSLTLRAPDR